MGDLVVQQFVSADGLGEDERGEFRLFDTVHDESPEFDRHNAEWLEEVGAILLGRKTYEQFIEYWPTDAASDELIQDWINSTPHHVVSTTLTDAPWGDFEPATVHSGDPAESVRRLKSEISGDVVVWGSFTLTDALFAAGVVDVLRLIVLPVALGAGRGVFPARSVPVPLSLRASGTFDAGLVQLEYDVVR